jgi:two-component system, NarL family, invasion response regulator UvrY
VMDPACRRVVESPRGRNLYHTRGQTMIRILIVDAHTVVRRGLRHIVSDEIDMTVVGEAQNIEEMLVVVRKEPCDVVVMEIAMPGVIGLEALKKLKEVLPQLPVLVLSAYPEDIYGVPALRLGASGYVSKSSAPEEMIRAIREVGTGRKYFSTLTEQRGAADPTSETGQPRHDLLSQRERQVLSMIARGKSIEEIADQLSLNNRTVRTYRTRILLKMAMKSDAELIHYAINNCLVV